MDGNLPWSPDSFSGLLLPIRIMAARARKAVKVSMKAWRNARHMRKHSLVFRVISRCAGDASGKSFKRSTNCSSHK